MDIELTIIYELVTIISVVITVLFGNRRGEKKVKDHTEKTLYRIEQLEKKVELHNNAVERLFLVERRLDVDEEKIRVANHRIDDLER